MTEKKVIRPAVFTGTPDPEPLPLFPPLPEPDPFPVDALGEVLAPAALAIATKVQCPVEIAALSVLGAASLAVQALFDVKLPFGQTRPTSLFLMSIAGSGDRKTTADTEAAWPIRQRMKHLKDEYLPAYERWKILLAAWQADKRKIEADKNLSHNDRVFELEALGPEPKEPICPILITGDLTPDGLTKNWGRLPRALGAFSAEGATFTAGHGMNADNRLRTAAMISKLWDGHVDDRIRAGDGIAMLSGRRLSVCLMIQRDAAAGFLGDADLRDQGLLSRMLVSAPVSIAGSRFYRTPAPEDEAAIRKYGARILALLERPLRTLPPGDDLDPLPLEITPEAEAIWIRFHDHIERQNTPGGDMAGIGDFASKAAEHAARLAAVIAVTMDPDARTIGEDAMRCGVALADYFVGEALRMALARRTDPRLLRAELMLKWMQAKNEPEIRLSVILTHGPRPLRTKAAADEAIQTLLNHGWIVETSPKPRKFRMARPEKGGKADGL